MNINESIIRLFGDQISELSGKIDGYHAEVKAELMAAATARQKIEDEMTEEKKRTTKLEVEQKVLRVWGLVALFAGSAGGVAVANLLHLG